MKPVHTKYASAETLIFPNAVTVNVLLSGKDTDGNQVVFEDIVEPGIGPGWHIHHEQDEIFFFLEGDFIAEVAGQLMTFKAGNVAFIPRCTVHAFKNVGTTKGRLRYIFSPALTIEGMFREFYDSLQSAKLNAEVMAQISLKHGQEFVGPPS